MPFGPWPGVASGSGPVAGAVIDYAEWYGDQLMIVDNADWPVNANAPTDDDSNNAAWKVSQYVNPGTETGRGFRRRVFAAAAKITLGIIARGDGVDIAGNAVYILRYRAIDVVPAAAVPAWSTFVLTALAIRADAFHVGYEQEITIGASGGQINLTKGRYHQFELLREQSEGDSYDGLVSLGGVALQQNAA